MIMISKVIRSVVKSELEQLALRKFNIRDALVLVVRNSKRIIGKSQETESF